LWLSGNAGISRLSKQDLNDMAAGRAGLAPRDSCPA
jgi:hypothetical protein